MAGLLGFSVGAEGLGPRGVCEEGTGDPVVLVLDKLTENLVEGPKAGGSREEVRTPQTPVCSSCVVRWRLTLSLVVGVEADYCRYDG